MINAARKKRRATTNHPALLTIIKQAKLEHQQTEEMFDLLGWGELPAELKFEIENDVKGYVDELLGRYSTNSSFVQRRRETVDFWVQSFLNKICSLETAVEALKIKSL